MKVIGGGTHESSRGGQFLMSEVPLYQVVSQGPRNTDLVGS